MLAACDTRVGQKERGRRWRINASWHLDIIFRFRKDREQDLRDYCPRLSGYTSYKCWGYPCHATLSMACESLRCADEERLGFNTIMDFGNTSRMQAGHVLAAGTFAPLMTTP